MVWIIKGFAIHTNMYILALANDSAKSCATSNSSKCGFLREREHYQLVASKALEQW